MIALCQRQLQQRPSLVVQAYRFADHIHLHNNHPTTTTHHIPGMTYLADLPPPPTTTTTIDGSCDCHDDTNHYNCPVNQTTIRNNTSHHHHQQQQQKWKWTDSILSSFWKEQDGYTSTQRQQEYTYGEVTSLGVRQLAFAMGITTTTTTMSSLSQQQPIVFYDLGSGVGRLVIQLALDYMTEPSSSSSVSTCPTHSTTTTTTNTTNSTTTAKQQQQRQLSKVIGIELSQERHDIAVHAWQQIHQSLQYNYHSENDNNNNHNHTNDPTMSSLPSSSSSSSSSSSPVSMVQLIHGDVLQVPLDKNTTHVYISSLCFPSMVLEQLQEILLTLSSTMPNLQVVAALNRLPMFVNDWKEVEVPIQMTWGPGLAKIYIRQTEQSPSQKEQSQL